MGKPWENGDYIGLYHGKWLGKPMENGDLYTGSISDWCFISRPTHIYGG